VRRSSGASVRSRRLTARAKTAAQTADKNNALQTDIYNQNKAALAPYQDGGKATMAINNLLGSVVIPDRTTGSAQDLL
jgi:hypothetical protein